MIVLNISASHTLSTLLSTKYRTVDFEYLVSNIGASHNFLFSTVPHLMVPMAFPVAFPIPPLGKIPSLVEEESQVVRIKWILNDHDHDDTNIPSFQSLMYFVALNMV